MKTILTKEGNFIVLNLDNVDKIGDQKPLVLQMMKDAKKVSKHVHGILDRVWHDVEDPYRCLQTMIGALVMNVPIKLTGGLCYE